MLREENSFFLKLILHFSYLETVEELVNDIVPDLEIVEPPGVIGDDMYLTLPIFKFRIWFSSPAIITFPNLKRG